MQPEQSPLINKGTIHTTLSPINVNDHKEMKGKFSYLSWTWAISTLQQYFPNSGWHFLEDLIYADGSREVRCVLTIEGNDYYMWLPVMDHRNQAIQNPTATDVNKARMRCLTKAIAVAGLGFYIFEGEDLPTNSGTMAGVLPTSASPDSVTTMASQPSPISTDNSDVAISIIPVGKAKGKTYGEIFTNNTMVADAIKYWTSHATKAVQRNHLDNLKALRVVMALDVKGVA